MQDFIHLHNHSDYSILDGAQSVEQLVLRAKELDMPAIALTEHGNLFSAIEFYNIAKKHDVKPILGCELYVAKDMHEKKVRKNQEGQGNYHLTVLAKNKKGFSNIIKLSSRAYTEGFYYNPRVDKDLLREYNQGIIALSGCIQGEVQQETLKHGYEKGKELALEYADIFPDRFYLEVMNHDLEDEATWRKQAKKMSEETGLPRVATNDSHYAREEHWEAHDIHICIGMKKDFEDENRVRYTPPNYWVKSQEEMERTFPEDPEVFENTIKIAEQCNVELEFGEYHLPEFPIPEEFESNDPDEYLEHLVWERVDDRYDEVTEEVKNRIEHELAVIKNMGFAGYFLIVQDFVVYAKNQDIPVGPGRGSAAGSIVTYILGITDVDPLRFDLIFERFLNPERVTMPDIDIDFCIRRRENVIDYLREQYGQESVCNIITFGKMKAKNVIRDVGRVLQVPLDEVDRMTDLIDGTLEESIQQEPELQEAEEEYEKLFEVAKVLENKNRNTSTHAAGVIVAPGKLTDYIPICIQDEEVTTQYEMSSVEQAGMLKVDFLGLRNLTVIDDTLDLIERKRGIELDSNDIPMGDEETFELFGKGYTVGVFQFESEGMQENLRKLKPDCVDDLIAMNALYRPGPMKMIDDFIARKHGEEEVEYLHPDLEPILKDTFGIIVYQEQVMRIGAEIAGFSLGESDILRRAMGKKKEKVLKKMGPKFIEGAVEHGLERETAEELYDLIMEFADYGFNKSHAAAYAILAYKIGYLKAHYPVEFMSANLTSEIEDSDRVAILSKELDNLDSGILPPDVNKSEVVFVPEDGMIRYGLNAIKNVGEKAAQTMVEAVHEEGPFDEFVDFVAELDLDEVNSRALECIVLSGATDSMRGNRKQKFEIIDRAIKYGKKIQEERNTNQLNLFGSPESTETNEDIMPKPEFPNVKEYDEVDKLLKEKELLGMYLTGHPLQKYEDDIKMVSNYDFSEPLHKHHGSKIKLGGMLKSVTFKYDKNDRKMAFIELRSIKGTINGIIFSSLYQTIRERKQEDSEDDQQTEEPLLEEDNFVYVEGKVDCESEDARGNILVRKIEPLEGMAEKKAKRVHIPFLAEEYEDRIVKELKDLVRKNQGNCELVFHIKDKNGNGKKVRSKSFKVTHEKKFIEGVKDIFDHNKVWVEA